MARRPRSRARISWPKISATWPMPRWLMRASPVEATMPAASGWPKTATLASLGLYALQHRGQESAGIVASNGEALISHRGMGHVAEIFGQEILARLRGRLAIGHNRYSTSGSTVLKNCQPFVVEWAQGALAI